jgi:chlorobactene glucosyltransferase
MTAYLTHGLIVSFIYFQIAILVIILSNILILHRARKHSPPSDYPSVSILVPARNEENNIQSCIQSLAEQDYPNYEIIALDDQSSDSTPVLLAQLSGTQPKLKVLTGSPASEEISGKNWACTQLAQEAKGDLLLFTDADTVFEPQALREVVGAMAAEKADLLTGYPRQVMNSWGERLLVPFFSWAMLCFIPLWLAQRLQVPALSSAVGQMMLFKREAYYTIGGHARLGSVIVEDLALARQIKAAGLKLRVTKITSLISCRMYQSSREALDGFSRNLFAFFDFRLLPYLFVYIWLGLLFLEPLFILAAKLIGAAPNASFTELFISIALSVLVWCIPYVELGLPALLGVIYPFTMVANEIAALQSMILSLTGRLAWKGRPLARPKWKWL